MIAPPKRAYEAPASGDGYRVLVDRMWPRGVARQALSLDAWRKDLAPSAALRKWFAHDPRKWDGFKGRYFGELDSHPEAIKDLVRQARVGRLTLVYGAKNEKFNNAVALQEYLERHMRSQ